MSLLDLYRAEIGLLLGWQGGRWALLRRLLATLLISMVALALTAGLVSGIQVDSPAAAALGVLAMCLFNAVVRPAVLALVAPVSVLLVGAVALVLQVGLILVVLPLVPGIHVDGLASAFFGSWVLALVNGMLTGAFSIDSGGTFYGHLVRRWALRSAPHTDSPGVVIVQIDGLAHPILAGRIRAGYLPTLSSLVRSGSHALSRWEPQLPSMTSASQAGILFGSNEGIPGFRWYERDRHHVMVSSNPDDAAEISRRLSNGDGLLSPAGTSIGNLFSGDAARSFVTAATFADKRRRIRDGRPFLWFFLNPTAYLRSVLRFLRVFLTQRLEARRIRRSGIQPQVVGGFGYALRRALSAVILRDLNTSLVIREMYRSTPVVYVDFTEYDEVAHHAGPERLEALQALDGIDRTIGSILAAAADAPRPYQFVFLSDHGQSLGMTFAQRYRTSLPQLIRELAGPPDGDRVGSGPSDIIALGSGNLGLVYLGLDHRMTLEEIERAHPRLLPGLSEHPGIGLVLVRSATNGPIAMGRGGRHHLETGEIDGLDPTLMYGPRTVSNLRREDGMAHAPDILLLSSFDPDLGEVAAFEDLIGSHGGLGGFQTEAFILHPAGWRLDGPVVGAPEVHRNLKRWLGAVGIAVGAADAGTLIPAPSSTGMAATEGPRVAPTRRPRDRRLADAIE